MEDAQSSRCSLLIFLLISGILSFVNAIEFYNLVTHWNDGLLIFSPLFEECIRYELLMKTVFSFFSLFASFSAFLVTSLLIINPLFFIDKLSSSILSCNYFVFGPILLAFSILGILNIENIIYSCDKNNIDYNNKVLSFSNLIAVFFCFLVSLVLTIAIEFLDSVTIFLDSILRKSSGHPIIAKVFWIYINKYHHRHSRENNNTNNNLNLDVNNNLHQNNYIVEENNPNLNDEQNNIHTNLSITERNLLSDNNNKNILSSNNRNNKHSKKNSLIKSFTYNTNRDDLVISNNEQFNYDSKNNNDNIHHHLSANMNFDKNSFYNTEIENTIINVNSRIKFDYNSSNSTENYIQEDSNYKYCIDNKNLSNYNNTDQNKFDLKNWENKCLGESKYSCCVTTDEFDIKLITDKSPKNIDAMKNENLSIIYKNMKF